MLCGCRFRLPRWPPQAAGPFVALSANEFEEIGDAFDIGGEMRVLRLRSLLEVSRDTEREATSGAW